MTENTTLRSFAESLPSPEILWASAEETLDDDPDFNTIQLLATTDTHEYNMYRAEDGAGNEATIVARMLKGTSTIDAMLVYPYDHESHLTANIADTEGAARQPALKGLPEEVFAPAMKSGSAIFWKYDGFPATFKTIFATAAVWFVNGEWKWARDIETSYTDEGDLIKEKDMVKQFISGFKGFKL